MRRFDHKKYELARASSQTEIGKIIERTITSIYSKPENPSKAVLRQNYLDVMFAIQKDFEKPWVNFKNKNVKYKEERTEKMLVSAIEELIELRREINVKEWKRTRKGVNVNKIREELIDVIHFVITIALIWDLTPTSLFEKFIDKQMVNRTRQKLRY